MTMIIGIDPGSRITGYGIVEFAKNKYRYITCGCIRTGATELNDRLHIIYQEIIQLIHEYRPQAAAIEQVFMHKNANSALKLGQARGAAIVALNGLPLGEYSPRQIKQAVVGYGGAQKGQIQHMVRVLLNLAEEPQADAADALAVAICHGNSGVNY